MIGEQNGLAQQRGAQLFVGRFAEIESQAGETLVSFPHLGRKQVGHMPTPKDVLDLFLHSGYGRLFPRSPG